MPVIEAPLTVRSFAKHNIENAMIAIALSFKLGISFDVIEKRLEAIRMIQKSIEVELMFLNGIIKLLYLIMLIMKLEWKPFLNMVKAYDKGGKKYLMIGTTGDRKYLISGINDIILKHNLDFIVIKETEKYLRGAKPLELPLLIRKDLADKGYDISNTYISHGEIDGVKF